MSVEVERVDAEAAAATGELLSEGDRPFLLSGSVDDATRARHWSPAALRSLVGAREVPVVGADGGRFDYTLEGAPLHTEFRLPFDEALGLIASARAPGPCYYLRRPELADLGLEAEAGLPRVFAHTRGPQRTLRLWVSSEGSVTPLHYDTRNNFLTQMHGRKAVTLFPSSEHARMYPLPFSGTHLLSPVDPEAVDAARFPRFPSELALRVELLPGQTLFIPPFWWHHVRSLDFSISVNVFWRTQPRQLLVPNSTEYLRVMYARDRLRSLFAGEGERPAPTLLLALAAQARERGLTCAATLLCAAAVSLALDSLTTDERDALTTEEHRRVEHCLFLGDFAAAHGKAPKSSELEAVLAGVADFAAARHSRRTNARGSISIQE